MIDITNELNSNTLKRYFLGNGEEISFRTLDELKMYPNAVVVCDDESQIYLTAPLKIILCDESTFKNLIRDIDELFWHEGQMFFGAYEYFADWIGDCINPDELWLDRKFKDGDYAVLNLAERVKRVASGTSGNIFDDLSGEVILSSGRGILHLGAEKRHIRLCQQAMRASGIDLNRQDECGTTALHICVENNLYEIASDLLNLGANPNLSDKYGRTPLHFAAAESVDFLNVLLNHGANIHARTIKGRTVQHIAADSADPELVKKVISLNMNINDVDFTFKSPLYYAEYLLSLCIKNRSRDTDHQKEVVRLIRDAGGIVIAGRHNLDSWIDLS